jgi:hypothetical protein
MFKLKNHQASILAATLIIMSIMLASAIAVLTAAVRDRRISMDASHSVTAFQTAEQGIEQVISGMMKSKIYSPSEPLGKVNALTTGTTPLVTGTTCNASGKVELDGDRDGIADILVEFLNENGNPIACNSTDPIKDIKEIKASGTKIQNARAVQASSPCFGADPNSLAPNNGIVGWWKMNNSDTDLISGNNINKNTTEPSADNCPDDNLNASYSNKVGRSALVFNNNSSNKCEYAEINHNDNYLLDTGSVSFWLLRETTSWGNANQWPFFMKDADGCAVDPADKATCALNIDAKCDCGHLNFNYLLSESEKFYARFQNDGNWNGSQLYRDGQTLDTNWHLATLNFNRDRYQLFLDGKLISEIWKASGGGSCEVDYKCDRDEIFEGLVHNKNKIYLGRGYYDPSGDYRKYLNGALRDLRIYKRTLTKCEVNQMYNTYLTSDP